MKSIQSRSIKKIFFIALCLCNALNKEGKNPILRTKQGSCFPNFNRVYCIICIISIFEVSNEISTGSCSRFFVVAGIAEVLSDLGVSATETVRL